MTDTQLPSEQARRASAKSRAQAPAPKGVHAPPAKHAYTLQELRDLGYGSAPFLYEEMAVGNLVGTKLGRRTVVLAEHLEAWLASRPLAVSRYRAGRRQASTQGRAKC